MFPGGTVTKSHAGNNISWQGSVVFGIAMAAIEKRTFSLPTEQTAFIDAQVASGAFASASEVVRAGLRALQERDAAVERWLREEVASTYDAMQANPGRAVPAKAVFDEIRARYAGRLKDSV